ncbi:MAG TPA: methyltetrahydrofolate cobalamin methyltransferase [bacterium]|nr:methyltetrahydrofolate cobalamin methyltransferase [bacterium]
MLIVAENINTSRKQVAPLVENKDKDAIQDIARKVTEAGAGFVDVNCGTFVSQEVELLPWLVSVVQEVTDKPVCVDSPNPKAMEAALAVCRGQVMLNSITAETARYESLIPMVKKYRTKVIALCMDDAGMPETVEERLNVAKKLVGRLESDGVSRDDIYVDPLVRPIGAVQGAGKMVLDTIWAVMHELKGVHTICGLSNVSFGLPVRKLLNQTFEIMCMTAGLDSVIMNPLDKQQMAQMLACEALLGSDEYCMNYVSAHREGKLELV